MAKQVKGIASEKRTPFTQEQLTMIQRYCQAGLNYDQIALLLDMSTSTLERHIKDTPGGADVIKKGRATAVFRAGETAYQMAVSKDCPSMTMFYLKCQGRWRDVSIDEKPPITESDAAKLDQELKEHEARADAIRADLAKYSGG